MGILIDLVRVSGFRGIRDVEVNLSRVSILIGSNNSGKTSFLKALQLALGDHRRYLTEEDFYIDGSQERAEEILIDVRIVSVDTAGNRVADFESEWRNVFLDAIQTDVASKQLLGIRTRVKKDPIQNGFEVRRTFLKRWPSREFWRQEQVQESKLDRRFQHLPFLAVDAQRDIKSDLRDRSSFLGRVLAQIEYDPEQAAELERMIQAINDKAVAESPELGKLKSHLENLSRSFQGAGTASVSPLPSKMRDMSKTFSVTLGEDSQSSFPMEYHGMGTRSWASLLTIKAFIELESEAHREEVEPFFPVVAIEEPEAHLHPNAQKTLYKQLADIKGQVIVTTHSPYVVAVADPLEVRSFRRDPEGIQVKQLDASIPREEARRIRREVINTKGEVLFSSKIVLCEGETEEQALPILFEKYFGNSPFELGITFVGVGGNGEKYRPFLTLQKDLGIPVFIFSDGEPKVVNALVKTYKSLFGPVTLEGHPRITVLDGTDFESYLISSGHTDLIEKAIVKLDGSGAVDNWISTRSGTPEKPTRTSAPPCTTCGQPIFEGRIRDYSANGGRELAILEIIDKSKPKYAPMIAHGLGTLVKSQYPDKIRELFEKLRAT